MKERFSHPFQHPVQLHYTSRALIGIMAQEVSESCAIECIEQRKLTRNWFFIQRNTRTKISPLVALSLIRFNLICTPDDYLDTTQIYHLNENYRSTILQALPVWRRKQYERVLTLWLPNEK